MTISAETSQFFKSNNKQKLIVLEHALATIKKWDSKYNSGGEI